ncbi:hypothetical protein [uncultured Salipiger sp.]|uniref:hypothetical protein n=1 Tax=uncultured Salipiger sp. TaxID=499810 RepID=UPI00259678AB|nr:hypothetical protein [uncultured Salipiger sp.]
MAKPRNTAEVLARDAAKRLEEARRTGEQLSLLADEPGRTPAEVAGRKPGRPKGATGKGSSQMRDWLAAKGYRLPEQQLSEMAGLASSRDVFETAMTRTEQILAWAFADALCEEGKPRKITPEQRLSTFAQVFAVQLRAAEALLPYGTPKASPDVAVNQAVTLVVQGGGAAAPDPARDARDVTPSERAGLVPADVRWRNEQNQWVSETQSDNSDGAIRTDEASD